MWLIHVVKLNCSKNNCRDWNWYRNFVKSWRVINNYTEIKKNFCNRDKLCLSKWLKSENYIEIEIFVTVWIYLLPLVPDSVYVDLIEHRTVFKTTYHLYPLAFFEYTKFFAKLVYFFLHKNPIWQLVIDCGPKSYHMDSLEHGIIFKMTCHFSAVSVFLLTTWNFLPYFFFEKPVHLFFIVLESESTT